MSQEVQVWETEERTQFSMDGQGKAAWRRWRLRRELRIKSFLGMRQHGGRRRAKGQEMTEHSKS